MSANKQTNKQKNILQRGGIQQHVNCVASSWWNINMKLCKHILFYMTFSTHIAHVYLIQYECGKKHDWLDSNEFTQFIFAEINWMLWEWENVHDFFSLFPAVKMFRILFGVSFAFYAYKLNWIQFPLREEIVCAISVLSAVSSFRRSFSGTWRKNMRSVRTFAAPPIPPFTFVQRNFFGHWSTQATKLMATIMYFKNKF